MLCVPIHLHVMENFWCFWLSQLTYLFSISFHWTEDKIWTVVQHNNTELTRVRGTDPGKPYTMNFNYNSSMEQLEVMINSAEYCEQEAAYHCKKSRLLNTPSKCHKVKSFLLNSYWLHSRYNPHCNPSKKIELKVRCLLSLSHIYWLLSHRIFLSDRGSTVPPSVVIFQKMTQSGVRANISSEAMTRCNLLLVSNILLQLISHSCRSNIVVTVIGITTKLWKYTLSLYKGATMYPENSEICNHLSQHVPC